TGPAGRRAAPATTPRRTASASATPARPAGPVAPAATRGSPPGGAVPGWGSSPADGSRPLQRRQGRLRFAEDPSPRPPPRSGEGGSLLPFSPLRLGEGAGGGGWRVC